MACPGKWKHGLKPAVHIRFNVDPYPYFRDGRHLALGTPRADILRLTGMDEPEESEEPEPQR